MHLLDVNVLIALGDSNHVHHQRAQQWFHSVRARPWATCTIVEHGFLRIFGHPQYPDGPGSTEVARQLLERMCSLPGHLFWSADFTLLDRKRLPVLPPSKQLTDYYLLALAIHNQGKLATLDHRIDASLLPRGPSSYLVIPPA